MNCNPHMPFSEQDYHLVKTSVSKDNNQKEVLRYLTNVLPNPTDIVILDNAQDTVKSVKAQLANKNLLDPSLYNNTATFQGITYTTNGDTITLTGTAKSSSYVNIFSSNSDAVIPLPSILQNKKIKLYTYGNSYTVELLVRKTTGVNAVIANTNQSIDTTGAIGFSIRCRFTSGNTYNDSIKFMIIEEGAENNPAYIPYISDFSTVKVIGCGKNLFDKSTLRVDQGTKNLTQTSNGFTFETAATKTTMSVTCDIFLSAGTYYCSGTVSSSDGLKGGWGVYDPIKQVYIVNASSRGTINDRFTITESKTYNLKFFAPYSSAADVIMTFTNVQLEFGTTATDYEPYKECAEYTPTATGEATGIEVLTPTTNIINDKGLLFTKVVGDDFNYIN